MSHNCINCTEVQGWLDGLVLLACMHATHLPGPETGTPERFGATCVHAHHVQGLLHNALQLADKHGMHILGSKISSGLLQVPAC